MNNHTFCTVLLRLIALWLLTRGMLITHALLTNTEINTPKDTIMLYMGVNLLLTPVCWFGAGWISRLLLPKTVEESPITLKPRQMAALGSALIGLWSLFDSADRFMSFLYIVVKSGSSKNELIPTLLQISFSLWLLLRPWTLARLIWPATQESS